MSNALGPAQIFSQRRRRRWPALICLCCLLLAVVMSVSPYGGAAVASIFFVVCSLPFGAVWIKDRGGLRTLAPVALLTGDHFWRRWWGLAMVAFIGSVITHSPAVEVVLAVLGWGLVLAIPVRVYLKRRGIRPKLRQVPLPSTVRELHEHMAARGGGGYLATRGNLEMVLAPRQAAILVLAGPRKGKSSCVVSPAIAGHPGAVVSTSTKLELLRQTLPIRSELGTCWYADLGGEGVPVGCQELRWSPLARAADWDQAMMVADAMVRSGENAAGDKPHWKERGGALLACCLHAAALSGRSMRDCLYWIMRHDGDTPLGELEEGSIAHATLYGITKTDPEERSGIFSTAARVLQAYRSEAALAIADSPNFDPNAFARSTDTLYIAAPGERQRLLAPLVVGLLVEIRQARYRAYREQAAGAFPLLMALDEARNIAPIPDLPQQLSEGGGQGVQTMVVLQSLAQARAVWNDEGAALMDFTDALVVMGGVSDKETCETISRRIGQWDRPIQTVGEASGAGLFTTVQPSRTESWSTRREAIIPPDQVARIAFGQALLTIGTAWEYVSTIPYDDHPVFSPVLAHACANPRSGSPVQRQAPAQVEASPAVANPWVQP